MSVHEQKLRALWQSLPSETVTFTSEQMQSRVRRFQAKHKRRDRIEYASYAVLFAMVAYMLSLQADWKDWVASGLIVVGGLFAMCNYYRLAGAKTMSSAKSSDKLLDFMRRELTRQRDAAASAWKWYILPVMPAVIFIFIYRWMEEGATLTGLTDMRISMLLSMALVIAVIGACTLWLFIRAARYQRQLEALDRYALQ